MENPGKPTPPELAQRFLLWFLKDGLAEEVMGDLEEKFQQTAEQHSAYRAKFDFWYQVFNYLRPFALRDYKSGNSNYLVMYQHNFKLAYRNFLKYKSTFLINLTGLSSGLACAVLIYLWVADELAMDKFHEKDKRLYQVFLNHEESGKIRTGSETQIVLASALEEEVPEVVMAAEDTNTEWFGDNFTVSNGKDHYKVKGKFSGSDYFRLFSYDFKYGDPGQVLSDKSAVVITESLAIRLFGSTDGIIGRTVQWSVLQFEGEGKVSGILKDLPSHSTDQFDFVLPFQVFKDMLGGDESWGNYNALTFLELQKGTDIDRLNEKIAGFVKEKAEWSNVTLFVSRFSDGYLYGNYENGVQAGGRIMYVRLFSVVAIFILVIACINFMNLTTARSSRRLKEIGVKKTLGAGRKTLMAQYLNESMLISFFSVILAGVLVHLILPQFNDLTGKQIRLRFSPELLAILTGITLFTGFLAGSYPAFYLSGFKPINVIKGKLSATFGEIWTRKGLVVFQFVLSIILITCVLVVYKQIEYIQTKNLGYDRENIVRIPVVGQAVEKIEPFLASLKRVPGVINASGTSHSIVKSRSFTTDVSWEGKDPGIKVRFEVARVYYDLIETLGIELKEGRSFSRDFGTENSKIIFNEAAIEAMGLEDPIGKTVKFWGADREIVGVMKNFHHASLHNEVKPMIFHFDLNFLQHVFIKINSGNPAGTIQNIRAFYQKFNPGYTLEYEFLDQDYQAQYVAEQRVSQLSRYFAAIAILISCLGLFALAAFTAERRLKEIGIRKIFGAGTLKIISLLTSDFTKIVLAAIAISLPIGYFIAQKWLDGFAFKISLEWWFFIGAGTLALLIAWLTVSIQIVKVSRVNPVECLKDE